jgi:hypothetical protein
LAVVSVSVIGVVLTACGSGSPVQSAANTPVLPHDASVAATISFDPFHNSLGDPLEAVNVHIVTNIPVPFRVKVDLGGPSGATFHFGGNYEKCISDGCYVRQGRSLGADWWCSNSCPDGLYKVTLDVCSYAENQDGLGAPFIRCNHQEHEYLDWVGHFGINLQGNALAKTDPDHSAILNLHNEVTFSRVSGSRSGVPTALATPP